MAVASVREQLDLFQLCAAASRLEQRRFVRLQVALRCSPLHQCFAPACLELRLSMILLQLSWTSVVLLLAALAEDRRSLVASQGSLVSACLEWSRSAQLQNQLVFELAVSAEKQPCSVQQLSLIHI